MHVAPFLSSIPSDAVQASIPEHNQLTLYNTDGTRSSWKYRLVNVAFACFLCPMTVLAIATAAYAAIFFKVVLIPPVLVAKMPRMLRCTHIVQFFLSPSIAAFDRCGFHLFICFLIPSIIFYIAIKVLERNSPKDYHAFLFELTKRHLEKDELTAAGQIIEAEAWERYYHADSWGGLETDPVRLNQLQTQQNQLRIALAEKYAFRSVPDALRTALDLIAQTYVSNPSEQVEARNQVLTNIAGRFKIMETTQDALLQEQVRCIQLLPVVEVLQKLVLEYLGREEISYIASSIHLVRDINPNWCHTLALLIREERSPSADPSESLIFLRQNESSILLRAALRFYWEKTQHEEQAQAKSKEFLTRAYVLRNAFRDSHLHLS